jgi:hypothetical protein
VVSTWMPSRSHLGILSEPMLLAPDHSRVLVVCCLAAGALLPPPGWLLVSCSPSTNASLRRCCSSASRRSLRLSAVVLLPFFLPWYSAISLSASRSSHRSSWSAPCCATCSICAFRRHRRALQRGDTRRPSLARGSTTERARRTLQKWLALGPCIGGDRRQWVMGPSTTRRCLQPQSDTIGPSCCSAIRSRGNPKAVPESKSDSLEHFVRLRASDTTGRLKRFHGQKNGPGDDFPKADQRAFCACGSTTRTAVTAV